MIPQPEFRFDFGSRNAYLPHLVIPTIEARTGANFSYVPILLGEVFKATNNVSPAVSLKGIKNKPEYYALETRRFLKKHAITAYTMNPHFPVNTLRLMRGAVFAQSQDYFTQYVDAMYHHMWAVPKKLGDAEAMRAALTSAGLPTEAIMAGAQQPEIKQRLIRNTEEAVACGVFGAPSFFVGDELFLGKDKLAGVEEELLAQRAASSGTSQ